jgi:hypothetical protein
MNNQKKFGVWMDNHQATIVGNQNTEDESLTILAHIEGEGSTSNSSEKTSNNHEKEIQTKFFKEIASKLVNATHVHVQEPAMPRKNSFITWRTLLNLKKPKQQSLLLTK